MDNMIYCEKVANLISINSSSMWRMIERVQYNAPMSNGEYYKNIMDRMPKVTRMKNIEYFVKYIKHEAAGCDYMIKNNLLTVYVNELVIGTIKIE